MIQFQKDHTLYEIFPLLFLITMSLWSADVDTKLYDGNNTLRYYEEVKKR